MRKIVLLTTLDKDQEIYLTDNVEKTTKIALPVIRVKSGLSRKNHVKKT